MIRKVICEITKLARAVAYHKDLPDDHEEVAKEDSIIDAPRDVLAFIQMGRSLSDDVTQIDTPDQKTRFA
jgi:hypothetical protein